MLARLKDLWDSMLKSPCPVIGSLLAAIISAVVSLLVSQVAYRRNAASVGFRTFSERAIAD